LREKGNNTVSKVSIIGAGAWGTALALAAFRAGSQVTIWSISLDEVDTINSRHENISRLPGIALDPKLQATTDSQKAALADAIILAPPAQYMRSTCKVFQKFISSHIPLVIASKGIENGTSLLMSEVVREFFPQNPLLVLTGPSFAMEVAKELPTAVVLAAETISLSQKMAALLSSRYFRLYASDDIIGTQIGGACKNIIAIVCGIVEGMGQGDNARAALISRGLAEITRLGCAMGAKIETFLGLSGVGDIILTSLGDQSRNKTFGLALGRGTSVAELLADQTTLTEGVHTVIGTVALAEKYHVDMPLTLAMFELFYKGGDIKALTENILNRPLKVETQ
jgi:glycerol-3-phosphate dehydrogenase (NAD(P)+)